MFNFGWEVMFCKFGFSYRTFRESQELVMMRREELLAREAWTLEDASVKHAIELWGHGDRISRLNPPDSSAPHEPAEHTTLPFPRPNACEKDVLRISSAFECPRCFLLACFPSVGQHEPIVAFLSPPIAAVKDCFIFFFSCPT